MNQYLQLHRLFYRLQQLNRFVAAAPRTGLSPAAAHFLIELQAKPDHSISTLAELLGLDQSSISRLAQELKRRKLLGVRVNRADRRRQDLRLTSKGRALIAATDSAANDLYRRLAGGLSAGERRELVKLFGLIADGYRHPRSARRAGEPAYRVQQRRITRCFRMLGDNVFGSGMPSSHWHILTEVCRRAAPPTPGELAEALGLAQNSLSAAVQKLSRSGLLKRRPQPGDFRSVTLHPTAAGRKLLAKIGRSASREIGSALSGVSQKKLARYVSLLEQFVHGFGAAGLALPRRYTVRKLSRRADLGRARGFCLRALVASGYEDSAPEKILGEKSLVLGLFAGESLTAVIEIGKPEIGKPRGAGPRLLFAAWISKLPSRTFRSFVERSLKECRFGGGLEDFILFPPLRDFLFAR